MLQIYFQLSFIIILIKACSYLQDEAMQLISTPQEVVNIQFASIFKLSQNNNKITLYSDDQRFSLISPIQLVENLKIQNLENMQIVSSKLYKTKSSRDPLHSMAILVKSNDGYYVEYNSNIYSSLPLFDQITERVDQLNSICYDIVLVDKIFIIDCQTDDQDYFSIGKGKYIPIEKAKTQQRKLDQIDNYIFRSTVVELELYIYEENTVQLLKVLDQNTLSQILTKESFKLEIKDFKTHTNGQFSILNAYGELIILEYNRQNNQWILIKNIDTKTQNALGYDIDIELNQYVVIQDKSLYFKSKTSQEYKIDVVLDEKNFVYLTKNYILFSKQNSLNLYNQNLQKLHSMTMDQSKYRIISNSNFDSIIALNNTEIHRYAINNNYYLQFKSDILQEQYSQISIVQDVGSIKCSVTIYYRVVPINTMEMYQTQASSALFAYGVNLDENFAQFQPACAGPNLKYEFDADDNFSVQVTNYQNADPQNVDSKEVIYRKAISNLNPQQIYLIQQKQNLEIEGFKCEDLSQTIANCQIWFQKIPFTKLEDSQKQLWWMNSDGLYYANLNDKSINIYFLSYEKKEFQQLNVIQLQTQGKSIISDGNHLFVLIDNIVEIYQINAKDWNKLTIGFNNVNQIFASSFKKNLLFVQQDTNIALYSLEYQKLTLIWFTTLESQKEIKIAITKFHFSILTQIQELNVIIVYNFENEGNIYLQRKQSLYHYAKDKIIVFDSNYFNHQLIITGTHDETQKQAILIYKTTEVSLNSQFMILNISSDLISVANNFVFITDTSSQKFYSYFIDGNYFARTLINPQYHQKVYNYNFLQPAKVSNTDFYRLIKFVPITLINRGTELYNLSKELNYDFKKDDKKIHCFDLGQSWYSGQALDIELQQPFGDITYEKTLIKQKESIESSQSIMEFDKNNLVQLMNNGILLISKEDFKITEFKLDNQYTFTNILYIKDNLIYVQAIINQQYLLKIIQYKDLKLQLIDGQRTYNYQIKKAFLNNDRFFIWILNQVISYDTKDEIQNLNQYEVIQRVYPSSYPESIEILHVKDQIYYFFSIGSSALLEIIAYDLIKGSQKNYFQILDITLTLQIKGFFLPLNFKCSGMVVTKNQVILAFNNFASHSYTYEIDCSRNYLCDVPKFEYTNSYQQYSSWSLTNDYPNLFQGYNILTLVYQSENDQELLIYDLNDQNQKPGLQSAIAYIKAKNLDKSKSAQSLVYNYNDQLHLLSSAEDKQKLQHYLLRRSPQVCTEKGSVTQALKFLLSNTYEEKVANLELKINQIELDPSGSKLWIILVIVGFILGIGICIVIYYCKKRKNQVNQNLLPNN